MLSFTIEKKGNNAVLSINGKVTREYFYDLRETLIIFLGTVNHVVISIARSVDMDLFYLRGLCSACNILLTLDKRVTLGRDRPDTFDHAVMESGFVCRKDCSFEGNKNCMLMKANLHQ